MFLDLKNKIKKKNNNRKGEDNIFGKIVILNCLNKMQHFKIVVLRSKKSWSCIKAQNGTDNWTP